VTGSKGGTLPNDYARFGTVIKGLDLAQKIESQPIVGDAQDGKPVTKITIKSIRIAVSSTAPATATSSTTAAPATSSTTAATTTTSKP
jgi:hypothetical protein